MKDVLNGFKEFISRGNVVELAVAVVIGGAFAALINTVVEALITPLIAMLFGEPNLSSVLHFNINGAVFLPGAVLDALITFVLIAAAVYFVIVLPINNLAERRARGQEAAPETPADDVALLTEIRDLLAAQRGSGRSI